MIKTASTTAFCLYWLFPALLFVTVYKSNAQSTVIINFECYSLEPIIPSACNSLLKNSVVCLKKIDAAAASHPLDTTFQYPDGNTLFLKSLSEGVYKLSIQNMTDTVINQFTFIISKKDMLKKEICFTYTVGLKLNLSKEERELACFCGLMNRDVEFLDGNPALEKFIVSELSFSTKIKLFLRKILTKQPHIANIAFYIMVDGHGKVMTYTFDNKETLPNYVIKELDRILSRLHEFKPALVYSKSMQMSIKFNISL